MRFLTIFLQSALCNARNLSETPLVITAWHKSPTHYFFSRPLLFRSPKSFKAVLHMGAKLSGCTAAHQLLDCKAQPFPVIPLA